MKDNRRHFRSILLALNTYDVLMFDALTMAKWYDLLFLKETGDRRPTSDVTASQVFTNKIQDLTNSIKKMPRGYGDVLVYTMKQSWGVETAFKVSSGGEVERRFKRDREEFDKLSQLVNDAKKQNAVKRRTLSNAAAAWARKQ